MSSTKTGRKLRILLVDDDADTRQLVTMIIEKAGHKIQTAGHGQAALTLLEHETFDIILLDIMMPEVDGLNVLEAIRRVSTAPVIMLTALSDAGIMEQSYFMGADDYIVKPFAMSKLLERIDRVARTLPPQETDQPSGWSSHYQLNLENNTLVRGGILIDLNPTEARLLSCLMDNVYSEVPIATLYEAGWGGEVLPQRTVQALVENTIRSLQNKLEEDPQKPQIITRTENGFCFIPEG
ncbi:response regulators consisting of a CheY-like receiver domain and a winged-helix DNA-binding domain [Bellilinea caldifistulae]|uniref:response regulator transcription factor n=1 Tax=Bellilinea caldifistulae TaxID=360411 RepID=UPI000780B7CB|nr:response regulator transcription factor [Bellilinea caldifistulae]GAP09879.1 response regulators consisting of a CheY-like receiver domain and a winged-helix DNA-binding domain [Bellilinea caldifistulae]